MSTLKQDDIQHIDDSLVLHGVHDERDAERFEAFNRAVNGDDQGETCAALLHHFPGVRWEDFSLVEDEQTGEVVATTCLIPWRLRIDGVTLNIAMLEMVVTHPAYRRRGLVRHQIDRFHRRAAAQGYDICIIEGIPHYYRQFGYAYALDHWAMDALPAAWLAHVESAPAVRLRSATSAHIPVLMQLYADSMGTLPLHAGRSADHWGYLLRAAHYPVFVVEHGANGAVLGYFSGWLSDNGQTALLVESSISSAPVAQAVLQQCESLPHILRIGWPERNMLVQVGRSLGGRPRTGDQWLIRIPQMLPLLQKFAPIWTARLAAAGWGGLTDSLTINFFRQAFRLLFKDGHLSRVDALGFVDASMGANGGDLCIPPDAFTRLLFGYRNLEELYDAWPDTVVRPDRRHLVNALFPRLESYVWLPYLHCGHLTPLAFL